MSTVLKIVLWTVVILVVPAAFILLWGKNALDKISFSKPRPLALDLQGITLADLANIALTGQSKTVKATIALDIKNDNNFSIPFSSLKAQLYYKNLLIATTSDMLVQKQVVPANGAISIADPVNIILNNAGGQFLLDKINGNHPTLDYVIKFKVFGIPLPSIKNNFVW